MRAKRRPRSGRGQVALLPAMVAFLGLAGSCKCRPTPLLDSALHPALVASVAQPEPPPLAIEDSVMALTRARAFTEARANLATLPPPRQAEPAYRFVGAYLAVRIHDGTAALPLLSNLESALPELAPDVERLRAEAQLQTADALVGAAWLDSHAGADPWYVAAQTLARLGRRDEALSAIERGMKRITRPGARATALLANYRALRAEVAEAMGEAKRALDDWRWLAVEAPSHAVARARVLSLLDSGALKLDATEAQQRVKHLAEQGDVVTLEMDLSRPVPARRLTNAMLAYLRGRVRQVARVDQRAGARLLELSADLGIENATQIRIDAARMYVREGDMKQAVRIYDQVANADRARRLEAQFYAARALSSLGEPSSAIERFSRLIERDTSGRWRRNAELERTACRFATNRFSAAEGRWLALTSDVNFRDDRPMLWELAGLAAKALGRTSDAVNRWQAAIAEAPLSLAAAFASARLRELRQRELPSDAPVVALASARLEGVPSDARGASSPSDVAAAGAPGVPATGPLVGSSAIANGSSIPPLASPGASNDAEVPLPRRTKQLLAFGIDELAAWALHQEDQKNARSRPSNAVEAACRAWRKVGYGEHAYVWSRAVRDSFDPKEPITDSVRWRWQCRYPEPYRTMVEEFENEYRLPRYLMWAVMRQESGFDPDIASPAGAVGLLQLLPTTASRVAEEFGIQHAEDLTEPRTNLRLGAAYLRKLLDSFGQNLVLAVAAYNAGPKAVALWQRHAGSDSVELFAVRIPYAETQKYVERVLGNLLVYRTLNGFDRNLEGLSLSLPEELKDSTALY